MENEEIKTGPVTEPVAPLAKKEETITITKSQLQAMIAEEMQKASSTKKPKRVSEHTAYIRMYAGEPVVKYANIRGVFDKVEGKNKTKLDIYIDGAEKPITVDYLEFLNADNRADVKILKQIAKETVTSVATGSKYDIKTDRPTDQQVEFEVKSVSYTVDLEILNGEKAGTKITCPADCLNS